MWAAFWQMEEITEMLKRAQEGGYGVGSFSARNTFLIDAVLKAAQAQKFPVIVQIPANEFGWFDVTAKEFAEHFYEVHKNYEGQAVLHLDHTKDLISQVQMTLAVSAINGG